MHCPKISVVMGVYNGEKYLREAVDSILAQTFTDFEFIIIDDGSTDLTLDIIKTYDDPRIRLIQNEKNLGLIKTLNKGFSESRGKYIARMDADDISLPERFRLQVEFLEANPPVALVGGQFSYIDGNGKIFAHEQVPTDNGDLQKQLLKNNCFAHPAVMLNSALLKVVGGYSEQALHAEDYELWLRIAENHQIANLGETILLYRIHENQISINKIKKQIDKARECRRDALQRRFSEPLRHDAYPVELTRLDQLRGKVGSYGESYYNWSTLYKKMGAKKVQLQLERSAFFHSPLSKRIIKIYIKSLFRT